MATPSEKINGRATSRPVESAAAGGPTGTGTKARLPRSYIMNYVLALFLPPVSVLLLGRPFLAILIFLIWIPAVIFSGGLTHPMFVILAWILIYQQHSDTHRA